MSSEEIAVARDLIVSLLRKAPARRLSGADLGNLLRERMKHSIKDLGATSLSAFVQQHLHDSVGMDITGLITTFYLTDQVPESLATEVNQSDPPAVPTPHPSQPAVAAATAGDLLRLLKSPNASYRFSVRKSDGATRSISPIMQPDDDEVAIPVPSADHHKQIATKFINELIPDQHREAFRGKLETPSWWEEWNVLFGQLLPANARLQWLNFRENGLLDIVDEELARQGVSDEARKTARVAIQRSRIPHPIVRTPAMTESNPARNPLLREQPLREIVRSVVEHMSDDELRRIWLPVGALVDAIRRNR
ncbi:MAG TPA: OST-HTH/LOTUS domain-containing protein [Polyangium sp.]|nr:OST-HTH/LOTUS domain-containing protein [Polyangium sp.]